MDSPNLSIVVPLLNEEESLPELVAQIKEVANTHNLSFEVILVDDGSKDGSWQVIEQLAKENPRIRGIKFRRNYGKSAALNEGFNLAKGEVVVTMDADLQDNPGELPALYKMITEQGFDMVSGWKKKRYDPLTKKIPSRFFNGVMRMMSGIKLHDFNCGLKAYKKQLVKSIEVYGEMHRFIPVIARQAGFSKIGEKVVEHRARQYGKSKFGFERFLNGFLDMLSIMFVSRFGKRPMHLFGLMGTLMFFIGFIILVYLVISKFFFHVYGMTDRPLFYFALITVILGTQLFLTGFIAELVARNSPERNNYQVEKTINQD